MKKTKRGPFYETPCILHTHILAKWQTPLSNAMIKN